MGVRDSRAGLVSSDLLLDIVPETFRILIADDLEDTRFVIRRALSRLGFQVEEATDGEMLLEKAKRLRPDLMIVDIMMPKLDGLSALSQIRQTPSLAHAYIILLTGKSTVDEKIEGFQQGADDYVTKPYSLAELKARVYAGIRLRAMHRSLTESQQILVRQEKMATIGAMAAGMAHEFNNIMGAISGYAQLAKVNEKFVERLINVALDQSERARKITTSLATFAATSKSEAKLTRPETLIESAMWLLAKEFKNRELELELEVAPSLPGIEVHVGKLQEVLVHLLLNAVQAVAVRDGDGRVQVRLRVVDSMLQFEVDDNGPGIPDNDRVKIFDPFFTTKGALGKSIEPGTGLGLTFSLNIVQSHGGRLDVVPSQLGGACLRIELPAVPNSESPAQDIVQGPAESEVSRQDILVPREPIHSVTARSTPVKKSAAELPNVPALPVAADLPSAPQPSSRVVVIEDDESLQELIREVVGTERCVVHGDGAAGLESVRTETPSFVVLDVTLSGRTSGWDVLEKLRELDAPPPVVLTSGALVDPDSVRLKYPNIQLLPKPYSLADLEAAVASLSTVPN